MYYGYTQLATSWDEKEMNSWKVRLAKALLFFIPLANPEHEKLYPRVNKWLLEIDDNGIPSREIALDINNDVLFISPNEKNTGFWTDSPNSFQKEELDIIEPYLFEQLWKSNTSS